MSKDISENIIIDKIYHTKICCINCGKGDNTTPEEYQAYLDEFYKGNDIRIDNNILSDTPCENCGCNIVHLTAKLKIKIK